MAHYELSTDPRSYAAVSPADQQHRIDPSIDPDFWKPVHPDWYVEALKQDVCDFQNLAADLARAVLRAYGDSYPDYNSATKFAYAALEEHKLGWPNGATLNA